MKSLVSCSWFLQAQPDVRSCVFARQSRLHVRDFTDSNMAVETQILGLDIKEV